MHKIYVNEMDENSLKAFIVGHFKGLKFLHKRSCPGKMNTYSKDYSYSTGDLKHIFAIILCT